MTINEARYQALATLMLHSNGATIQEISNFIINASNYYDLLCELLCDSLFEPSVIGLDKNCKPGINENHIVLWDSTKEHSFNIDTDVVFVVRAALTNFEKKLNILQVS